MEDGIERNMSLFITELEKKQQITRPKYEEQVHPIGLSLISRDNTPIGHDNTPIGHDNTPISHQTTPIVRQEVCREACPNTGREAGQETLAKSSPLSSPSPLAKTTANLPSTNTGSDS